MSSTSALKDGVLINPMPSGLVLVRHDVATVLHFVSNGTGLTFAFFGADGHIPSLPGSAPNTSRDSRTLRILTLAVADGAIVIAAVEGGRCYVRIPLGIHFAVNVVRVVLAEIVAPLLRADIDPGVWLQPPPVTVTCLIHSPSIWRLKQRSDLLMQQVMSRTLVDINCLSDLSSLTGMQLHLIIRRHPLHQCWQQPSPILGALVLYINFVASAPPLNSRVGYCPTVRTDNWHPNRHSL